MAAEYLIEYNLKPGDLEYADRPALHTSWAGRIVFAENPELDNRRAITVDSPEKQKEIIQNGNIGVRSGAKARFVIPSDLAGVQERERIRGVVLDYLKELGLVSTGQANEAATKEAEKLGVDLKGLKGTGKGGQITVWDVKRARG